MSKLEKETTLDHLTIESFNQYIQNGPSDFFNLSLLFENLKESLALYQKVKHKKYLILVGMGGSSLGVKAFLSALYPFQTQIMIFDSLDSLMGQKLFSFLEEKKEAQSLNDLLFYFVSKSGKTFETLFYHDIIENWLIKNMMETEENSPSITQDFFIYCCDKGENHFSTIAKKKNCDYLTIAPSLGGRYSLFSSITFFPLCFVNKELSSLIVQKLISLKEEFLRQGLFYQRWKNLIDYYRESSLRAKTPLNMVFFPYDKGLEDFSNWAIQLWTESLGKNSFFGPMAQGALGPRDQHSLLQLLVEGPKKYLCYFMILQKKHDNVLLKKFDDLNTIFATSTMKSLSTYETYLQSQTLSQTYEAITEEFFFWMLVVVGIGKMYDVNPFDQPGVEDYKKEVAKKLKE